MRDIRRNVKCDRTSKSRNRPFVSRDIPFLKKYDTNIIVNVCGKTPEEYIEVVDRLANEDVSMLEINISCPNVKAGGIAFGQDPNLWSR